MHTWSNCEVREKTNKMQQLDVYYQHFLNMFRTSFSLSLHNFLTMHSHRNLKLAYLIIPCHKLICTLNFWTWILESKFWNSDVKSRSSSSSDFGVIVVCDFNTKWLYWWKWFFSSSWQVKCAKCSEEMQKKFFERHNRMNHCGLGWIEGTDPIVSYIAAFLRCLEYCTDRNLPWIPG